MNGLACRRCAMHQLLRQAAPRLAIAIHHTTTSTTLGFNRVSNSHSGKYSKVQRLRWTTLNRLWGHTYIAMQPRWTLGFLLACSDFSPGIQGLNQHMEDFPAALEFRAATLNNHSNNSISVAIWKSPCCIQSEFYFTAIFIMFI